MSFPLSNTVLANRVTGWCHPCGVPIPCFLPVMYGLYLFVLVVLLHSRLPQKGAQSEIVVGLTGSCFRSFLADRPALHGGKWVAFFVHLCLQSLGKVRFPLCDSFGSVRAVRASPDVHVATEPSEQPHPSHARGVPLINWGPSRTENVCMLRSVTETPLFSSSSRWSAESSETITAHDIYYIQTLAASN